MPLPLPILDTRTFDQLVDEGHSIIPGSAPGWTDFNWHDPGITLIDLFAWLVEQESYRLDRVTEAAYRSFLRLVGVRPSPPQVAETVVRFSLAGPGPAAGVVLPAGVQVGSLDGSVVFQTTEALGVSPARLMAVLCGPATAPVDRSTENQGLRTGYFPLGPHPRPGDALYLGFDAPLSDQPMEACLYVWAGEAGTDRETRTRLIAEWNAANDEAREICPRSVVPDVPDWRLHYSARTVWEYYALPGVWTPLSIAVDETRALTLSGRVRFRTPPKDQQTTGGIAGALYAGDYFIRCRLAGGSYECPPEIKGIALNAAGVRHSADVDTTEDLGTSTGRAQQSFQLRRLPVVPHSTKVRVGAVPGAPEMPWYEELNWDRVGPHDRAYTLSPETGQIAFGDGRVGGVPPDGAKITATYQVGGGAAGNVAAGNLEAFPAGIHNAGLVPSWNLLAPVLQVDQPFAACGGADAEPILQAMGRAFTSLTEPRRGVTVADFVSLALATPGVPVARAFALADYDPKFPCFPALGSVTVVVLPQCPEAMPQPGAGFLKAAARYIERRRTITTEVHVIGPDYTTVSVSARLNVQPGTNLQQITQLAQGALADFLNPLRGGPDKNGWPVGRSVYRSDLLALLNALPGVVFVDQLTLQANGGTAIGCDNIGVCSHSVVASGQHRITTSIWRSTK